MRIDGELYWDGGILSNTPTERIFDDSPRRNSLIFAVHLWHPTGEEPETIWQILNRHKDIQYSSRIASHIVRQRETHKLRHVITKLLEFVPEEEKNDPLYQELAGYHCDTRMHVVRLLSPAARQRDPHQGHRLLAGRHRAAAGRPATPTPSGRCSSRPGSASAGLLDGVILHEPRPGAEPAAEVEPGEPEAGLIRPRPAQARGGVKESPMNACTANSAIQLFAAAFTYLIIVVWLEMFWVRIAQELHGDDIAFALRKRTWLNAFVAAGALGAAILLLFWVHSCTIAAA